MTAGDDGGPGHAGLPVAAVARRLGLAPSTLRTWDRRYGLGPAGHRERQHRRYSASDVARLEAVQRLLSQGVPIGEAVRAVADGTGPRLPAAAAPARPADRPDALVRRLREAALRLDADRVELLLREVVGERGVVDAWESVVRPAVSGVGDRWEEGPEYVAAEHLLSGSVIRVLDRHLGTGGAQAGRPVLLLAAPGEAHALPLHALAAALAERAVPTRVIGASTPVDAAGEAVRRLHPIAVVVWAQRSETADVRVFAGLPRARGGRLLGAAGPGWEAVALPPRVTAMRSLPEALDVLPVAG